MAEELISTGSPLGADLRGEISRRGILIRNQGGRPTCSVQTMVFLMEYQLTGLLGPAWRHLSVEYANHAANVTCNLRSDGHYFSDIAAGYDAMGIVSEALWPYNPDWVYDYEQGCRMANAELTNIGRQALADGARLKGRFIKRWGDAGLSDAEFAECLRMLDEGVPVAIGRDHSMALVGYRVDDAQPGGGVMYFRNSYGTAGELAGYQTETFEQVKRTVLDAWVYTV